MSIILAMLRHNVPLCQWKTFDAESKVSGAGFFSEKNPEKIVSAIINSLSHRDAVALVVKEFDSLPPTIRSRLMDQANAVRGNCSNNCTKGIEALNKQLNGRLLREKYTGPKDRVFVNGRWESREVNQAVAGAQRKYAGAAHGSANTRSVRKRDR